MARAPERTVEALHMLPDSETRLSRWIALGTSSFLVAIFWLVRPLTSSHRNHYWLKVFVTGALALTLWAMNRRRPRESAAVRAVRRLRRSEPARIGFDGVAFGDGGFVGYSEIGGIEEVDDRLVLSVKGRDPVVLIVPLQDWLRAADVLERGLQLKREDSDLETERVLRRGNEAEAVWMERTAALRTDHGYRLAAVDRSRLWKVLRDDHADPTARIAACTLLMPDRNTSEAASLCELRRSTAHPRLRDALERAERVS